MGIGSSVADSASPLNHKIFFRLSRRAVVAYNKNEGRISVAPARGTGRSLWSGCMNSVLSLILGGGRGTRLLPLTQLRSKPAVPIAGKYRLIDIPISNCINSELNRIYVLTQFLSVSLHRHIANAYKFDPFSQGSVEVLAAQQTMQDESWYQGTADAVRQQIRHVMEDRAE